MSQSFQNWLVVSSEVTGTTAPVVVALGWLFRWFVKRVATGVEARFDAKMADLATAVQIIQTQVENNGGTSVKDAVDRVDSRTQVMSGTLAVLSTDVAVLKARFSDHVHAEGAARS